MRDVQPQVVKLFLGFGLNGNGEARRRPRRSRRVNSSWLSFISFPALFTVHDGRRAFPLQAGARSH